MKTKGILISAALSCVLLSAATVGTALSASAATLTPTSTATVAEGVTYNYYETNYPTAKQKIYTASVNTSVADSQYEVVVHAVPGNNGFKPSYVTEIAEHYEETTGRKVYAGINGDFFATKDGYAQPQQAYAQDGVILWQGPNYGTGATKRSFGFDNKGHSVMGQLPTANLDIVKVHAASGEELELPVKLNPAALEDGDVAIYSTSGSKTIAGAAKYIVKITAGSVADKNAVGTTSRTVAGSVVDDKAVTIGSGQFAVVIKGENDISRWFYKYFMYGSTVAFEGKSAPSGVFEGMTQIVGGWADLVNGGKVISQSTLNTYVTASGRSLTEKADRTFFGMKADGTLVLCAVDGRNANGSAGLTVMQEAQLAGDLGLYNAIELDGGGSTTMVIRENDTIVQKNKPSDGGKRKVCNAVLIVEKKAEPVHEHEFGDWQKNATQHWKECECGEESERGAHVYADEQDTTCDTCGYVRTVTEPGGQGGQGGTTPAPGGESEGGSSGGCFGSIGTGAAAAALLAIGGAAILVLRLKKSKNGRK